MLGIQLIGILFGAFMLYFSFLHYKRREFTGAEFSGWILIWVCVSLVALFPNSLDILVKKILNLKRPLDFFIICGFLFLVFLSFYNYSATRKMEKRIQKLVSALALRDAGSETKTQVTGVTKGQRADRNRV